MISTLKIALAGAVAGSLAGVLLKKVVEGAAQIEQEDTVRDAKPQLPEPLRADDLRVAQNSPL
jgi:hypothetical protein